MTTLIIGQDIVQCVDCQVWYQPQVGHDCPRKDDPYRPSNIKPASSFSIMRRAINRDVADILERCERIKTNSHIGADGEWHVNEP